MVLRKKDSDLVSFSYFQDFFNGICNHAQVRIPIRKDEFVVCMVIGSAMHLSGVTVTIPLT